MPSKDKPLLNDISLTINPKDFVVLIGSNGCGKSSLIKVINGLLTPSEGEVFFEEKKLSAFSLSARARSIITLTQDLNLSTFSDLTVLQNCQIAFYRARSIPFFLSKAKERAKILEHLSLYSEKLSDRLDTPVSALSGGERQTLALAMSLSTEPKLLLLDEHTSALDPSMAQTLMALTDKMATSRGIATLMVTHHLSDALCYGNRLIAMSQGKIVLDASREEKDKLTYEDLLGIYK